MYRRHELPDLAHQDGVTDRRGQVSNLLLVCIALLLALLVFHFMAGTSSQMVIVTVGIAIFIVAFFKIDFALVILIFSMLLSPELNLGGIPGRSVVIRIDDILLFTVFFGWMARLAIDKDLGILRATPLNKPLMAYILICILSTLIGGLRGTTSALHGAFFILKYFEYFLLFFMVSCNIRSKKQVNMFLFFMFLTCLIVSLYGLWITRTTGIRATAPFEGKSGEANTLAGYLLLMMSVALGLILYENRLKFRMILGGYFVIMATTFLYTLSRGGWLGFFPMYITAVIISRRGKELLLIAAVSLFILAPIVFPQTVFRRVEATFVPDQHVTIAGRRINIDESSYARITSWRNSLAKWAENPIIGQGVPAGGSVSDVQYGRLLRETGLVGFAVFIWMIVALFRTAWKTYTHPDVDAVGKGVSLGFISALAGLLFMGISAEVFIIIRIMEPFWFLAAIVVMLPEISKPHTEPIPDTNVSPRLP